MRITFIGTGDAYSTEDANASVLVESAGFKLLIDCGPTVPRALWQLVPGWDRIDAVILTHTHPDHALGLPTQINRMLSRARSQNLVPKVLPVLCRIEDADQVRALLEYGYWPEPPDRPLPVIPLQPRGEIGPFAYETAPTNHSVPNRAIRLILEETSLFISGDGRLLPESESLAAKSAVAVLECQNLEDDGSSFHGNFAACRALAESCPDTLFFLTHVKDRCREKMTRLCTGPPNMKMARPGNILDIEKKEVK